MAFCVDEFVSNSGEFLGYIIFHVRQADLLLRSKHRLPFDLRAAAIQHNSENSEILLSIAAPQKRTPFLNTRLQINSPKQALSRTETKWTILPRRMFWQPRRISRRHCWKDQRQSCWHPDLPATRHIASIAKFDDLKSPPFEAQGRHRLLAGTFCHPQRRGLTRSHSGRD